MGCATRPSDTISVDRGLRDVSKPQAERTGTPRHATPVDFVGKALNVSVVTSRLVRDPHEEGPPNASPEWRDSH